MDPLECVYRGRRSWEQEMISILSPFNTYQVVSFPHLSHWGGIQRHIFQGSLQPEAPSELVSSLRKGTQVMSICQDIPKGYPLRQIHCKLTQYLVNKLERSDQTQEVPTPDVIHQHQESSLGKGTQFVDFVRYLKGYPLRR